jgi:hypothetical protein
MSKYTAKGCKDNKSVGWKWTSLMQVQFIIHLIYVHDIPSDYFSIQQFGGNTFNFSHVCFSILLLFLYSLVYSTVCTSAYFTAVHNLQFSRKYCWQIKVLWNVIMYQPATFQIWILLRCCMHKYMLRTYQTFLFLPHTEFYTTQTNVNTQTGCHVILPFYLHHVRPFSN